VVKELDLVDSISYNIYMFKEILIGLTILFLGIWTMIRPVAVYAQMPLLNVDFQAQDLTTGSNWQNPITVNNGDRVRFKATLTNSGGATALEVTVRMPLFSSTAKIQYPTFHILCLNASPPDAVLQVNTSGGAQIHYLPGSAVMIRSGANSAISPDTADANITTQQISVGNIAAGSSVTFQYDVSIDSNSANPTPTTTPGGGTATISAVAKSAPETGVGDSVLLLTGGWLVVAATGIALRKWATRILV
jgi:uncharacterized repeat protein (TIGR01451 family)